MSDELTQREQDDLRYMVLLATLHTRDSERRRQWISGGVAVLVAAVLGVVALAGYHAHNQAASPGKCDPAAAVKCAPTPTPSATAERPARSSPLPALPFPAVGSHASLPPDPALAWWHLFGALNRAEEQGLDAKTLQGFQRVGYFEPWVADMREGHQQCISIRTSDGSVLDPMECTPYGVAPSIERPYNDMTLRFVYEGGVVDVYVVAP